MSRRTLLAGNWKMNKTNAELSDFFKAFLQEASLTNDSDVDVVFAAPFTLLQEARKLAEGTPIRMAAQNVHHAASGAYTGEISTAMLKDIGIDIAIIGHSERRQYFNETDDGVRDKALACLEAGITPVVCVGETKEQRESGATPEVIRQQVWHVIQGIDNPQDTVIAYEPVWAIGTGLTATTEQAQEVHAQIRGLLAERFGPDQAAKLRILYGGSAKPGNIAELVGQPDIDGGLVGGASLAPDDFASMVQRCC